MLDATAGTGTSHIWSKADHGYNPNSHWSICSPMYDQLLRVQFGLPQLVGSFFESYLPHGAVMLPLSAANRAIPPGDASTVLPPLVFLEFANLLYRLIAVLLMQMLRSLTDETPLSLCQESQCSFRCRPLFGRDELSFIAFIEAPATSRPYP